MQYAYSQHSQKEEKTKQILTMQSRKNLKTNKNAKLSSPMQTYLYFWVI